MSRYAPLVTLGTVAALGGGLFLVNNTIDGPTTMAGTATAAAPAAAQPEAAPGQAPPAEEPAAPPDLAEAAFTGRTAGNEATVAIVVKDGQAVGYVCDGEEIEAWLEGTLTGADLQLEDADGETALTATVTEAATLGTVTIEGEDRPFAAEGVEEPAGLYEGTARVQGALTRIGWIVDGDGDVTGVATARGARGPAPTLDPTDTTAATIDGVPVTVTALDGDDRVIRR